MLKSKLKTIVLAIASIALVMSLILFPTESFYASVRGLKIWAEVVFPSLLPFFIAQELLVSFGVIQFVGTFLEPLMRPLFRLSSAGSTAWILGMASGYPAGAKISATLREKKLISRNEAERLVSFSNAASPLFIFGAIAVGFFHQPEIGLFIASCHYLSNAIVGICIRSYGNKKTEHKKELSDTEKNRFVIAFVEMHRARVKDERPFGQVLANAVISSIQTLLTIGGFIILFSVMTTLLATYHVFTFITIVCTPFLNVLSLDPYVFEAIITGLFEISIGAEMIANTENSTLHIQLAAVSFILGFNGLSIHAQVATILSSTDIRYMPYFLSRIFHACVASLMSLITFNFYQEAKLATEVIGSKNFLSTSTSFIATISKVGPTITIASLFIASIILYRRTVIR